MSTTPLSAVRSARGAHAAASLRASTAAPEELHRSGTLSRSGTTRWRTRQEKRPHRLTMPREALPARLSSFRLLAMASPPLDARWRSGRQGRASCGVCVPTPSMARCGRRAYPRGGEGTNRQRLGRRSHGCPVDQPTHCGRSDRGGEHTRRPAHERMTAAPPSSPYGRRWTDPVVCRAGSNAAKADVPWEETGVGTRGTAGVWVHASGDRGAESTPGRAKAQQGLATTCTDPLTEGQPREVGGSWSGA